MTRFRLKNVIAVDLPLGSVAFFILILILVIPFINPIPTTKADAPPPGQLFIHISWPAGNNDVDLWVKSPEDAKPVGYTRKDGNTSCALLRDDLGNPSPENEEFTFCRSMPNGRYVVNLHLYRGVAPIGVKVEVTVFAPGKPPVKFFDETVTLFAAQQERTAVTFELNERGLVPFSTNKVFVPIRSAK